MGFYTLPKALIASCGARLSFAADQTATNTAAAREPGIEIEVVASPVTQFEQTGPDGGNRVVVGRDQIERLSATDLPTALRQVPGVSISRYSPVGAYGGAQGGSVYLGGAGTARPGGEVRIYSDGVPRESGVWSHPLMDIVPIDFAERVTVAKNPQPQHYAGSFGAVDVETRRRLNAGHEGEANMAYGRFNTLISSASVGGKFDLFDYYAGAAYKFSEGAREHGEAELRSAFARAGWEFSEQEHLSYLFHATDNWVRDPGPEDGPVPQRDQFNTETATHAVRLDTRRDRVQGYALIYFEDGKIRWRKDHLSDGVMSSPPGYSNTDWNNYGFRSSHDIRLHRLTLTGSLDTRSEGGETWNIRERDNQRVWGYNGRFFTTAPYLGARYAFDLGHDWTLTPSAGARHYISSEFDNESAPYSALTLTRDGLSLFVSHARGVHYPGVYIRGVSPSTWRTLDSETLDTAEAGVHLDLGERAALHATLFHAEVNNRMDVTSAGYFNTGEMKAQGAEVSLHFCPDKAITLFMGGTYTDPVTHPVSRMPEAMFTAGGSCRVTRMIRWDLDAEYVSTQYAYGMRTVDPVGRDELSQVLEQQAAALLLATHDLDMARRVAQRFIVLEAGVVITDTTDFARVEAAFARLRRKTT